MKKRKLTLKDMSEILTWSIVIIQGIITIVCFVLACLTKNSLFFIPFVVFFFGILMISIEASDIEYEIFNFLKKHLPIKYFYNAGFSYAIRKDDWIELNVKTITINGKEISTKDRNIHIKELLEMVENGTEIYLDGTSEYCSFSEYNNLHLLISKKDLIEYLAPKHDENRLIDCRWKIKITGEAIYIKNNLIPNNDAIHCVSNKDTSDLLKRISRIQKETILDCILNNNYPILYELTDDDYCTNFSCCDDDKFNWQPMEFGTTFAQTELSNVQDAPISVTTNTPIGKLVQEIDTKLKQGFVFENIDVNRWNNVYRKMCVQAITSSYSLSEKQEEKLLNILHSLKDNMYDKKEKQHTLDTDVSIKAMEELLKYDGVINDLKM